MAGQHSLQLTSYQTECGSLKQQLDEKVKEVAELQEKVDAKEVENDDEIYLLKKEIKTLTELSRQSSSGKREEENLELLKKAKRREKEDMKQMKKLEEKIQKYKLVIKDSKKRKLEEDLKSNISFKIPKKSSVEKSDEVSLLELVSKAQEWTEKKKSEIAIPKNESESFSSLVDIPLPPAMELEETSNQRFYNPRSPPRQPSQWNPPPRRDERPRGFSRESWSSQRFDPASQQQQRGYHSQNVPAYDPTSPGLSYPSINHRANISRDPRRREASLNQDFSSQQGLYQQQQGGGQQSNYQEKILGMLNRAGHSTNAWQQSESDRWQSSMPRYRY